MAREKAPEKIPVTSGSVSIHEYGAGASVSATFTTATEEDGLKLKAAIEGLVEKLNDTPQPTES
jgi:hypothetical protein